MSKTVYIGQASNGENGITGNAPGNQTGRELNISKWYSRPWDHVIRCKDLSKAATMASAMAWLCKCKKIGYDQGNRTTLYNEIKKLGWENYTELNTKVETDCCALVDVCLNIAGYRISSGTTTYTLVNNLKKISDDFYYFTSSKYTQGTDYLKEGDILLNTNAHAALVLGDGAKAQSGGGTSSSSSSSGTSQGGFISSAVIGATSEAKKTEVDYSLEKSKVFSDYNTLYNLINKDINGTTNLKNKVKKIRELLIKGDNNKGTSAIHTTKNLYGQSISFLYDIYTQMSSILKSYKPSPSYKTRKVNLEQGVNTRLSALKIKIESLKNNVDIFDTVEWKNIESSLISDNGSISTKEQELTLLLNEVSNAIEKYDDQIKQQQDKSIFLQEEIDNQYEIINDQLSSYTIINNEELKMKNRIEKINLNLDNNFKLNFSNNYKYWNQNIIDSPNLLDFWFDFLDTKGELEEASVQQVGIRNKISNNEIDAIYYKDTPQVIYYDQDKIKEVDFSKTGYSYIPVNDYFIQQLTNSSYGLSAKEKLDELLYDYGYCTQEVQLTTVPIYYLEPNHRVFIYNKETQIEGEYLVDKISIPLAYNGTMGITVTKAPERLY